MNDIVVREGRKSVGFRERERSRKTINYLKIETTTTVRLDVLRI